MIQGELRDHFQGPFDENRVWLERFDAAGEKRAARTERIVAEWAEKMEDTFGCVTLVRRVDHTTPGADEVVFLAVVIPRTGDKETFEAAMSGIHHEILDEIWDNE